MGTATRKAQKRADKLAVLNASPDKQAARKEKLRMADSWSNRGENTGTFHKPENLSAKPLSFGRNRSHIVTTL